MKQEAHPLRLAKREVQHEARTAAKEGAKGQGFWAHTKARARPSATPRALYSPCASPCAHAVLTLCSRCAHSVLTMC